MNVTLGIDVGATTMSAGLVTPGGEVLVASQVATRRGDDRSPVDRLRALTGDLVAEAGRRGVTVDGIGVGLPGLVDTGKGMMIDTVNLVPEFAWVPLVDVLHAATGLPVFVDNDVNALALAERTFGLGRGADSLAVLAIGTGPGGAVILGDTLVRGHVGCAGEFGHIPINLDGPPCLCGGNGCLHLVVSGIAIAARGREIVTGTAPSQLQALAPGGDVTPRMVFEAAKAGDGPAQAVVDRVCQALGAGLAAIINTFNPEVVVVTGGVAESLVALADDIRRQVARYALARALAATMLHVVRRDKSRTMLGGAALVHYELHRARAVSAGR